MWTKLLCGKPQVPVRATARIDMSLVHPVNTSLCLQQLCESNFHKLSSLIPQLSSITYAVIGRTKVRPDLYLEVLSRSNHTLTIELSHCFADQADALMEPAVRIRVYLDAKMAEVLSDHARTQVFKVYRCPSQSIEIRDYKWQLNYFLEKWLKHCLQNEYTFSDNK